MTTAPVALRLPAPWRVVWDGQSYNNIPAPPDGVPSQTMRSWPSVPWANVSINGTGFAVLASTVVARRDPWGRAPGTILIMNGGQSDVLTGVLSTGGPGGLTGATAYAVQVAYAASARAAGFAYVVGATVPAMGPDIAGTGQPTGSQQTAIEDLNDLIRADPSGAFDAVADLAAVLTDATDEDLYLADRLHPTPAGAAAMAAVWVATLTPLLT